MTDEPPSLTELLPDGVIDDLFLVIVIVLVLNVVTVTGVLRRILPDVVHVVLEA